MRINKHVSSSNSCHNASTQLQSQGSCRIRLMAAGNSESDLACAAATCPSPLPRKPRRAASCGAPIRKSCPFGARPAQGPYIAMRPHGASQDCTTHYYLPHYPHIPPPGRPLLTLLPPPGLKVSSPAGAESPPAAPAPTAHPGCQSRTTPRSPPQGWPPYTNPCQAPQARHTRHTP